MTTLNQDGPTTALVDHERIWLQPKCCAGPDGERLWCQNNVWPDSDDCDKPGVEYVLSTALKAMTGALCEDEGCPQAGTIHVCISVEAAARAILAADNDDLLAASGFPEQAATKFASAALSTDQQGVAAVTEVGRDQREHFINAVVEDGQILLDVKAWLRECHDWLLENDLDMKCSMDVDPLDLIARIDRSFGFPAALSANQTGPKP